MAQIKTQATQASVADYIAAIEDPLRQSDCRRLVEIFAEVTGEPATMWGPSIVGFGQYHYRYASGHSGSMCLVGFSSRKTALTLYLACDLAEYSALLAELGKYKAGKGCLYVKRLSEIEIPVLKRMVDEAAARARQRSVA